MDKIYEKTRYANIYRHSKNGNYVIRHDSTTISKINSQKIYDIKVAKDYKAKLELNIKKIEQSNNSYLFKDLWNEYIYHCENIVKLSFNTVKKKKIMYNCYFYELGSFKINELSKEHNGKVNKTCEYSKETNACLKDRCKSIKKYLSEEDIKKLIDYCKKGITRLEKATSTASKKIDPCIDKEKALTSKFQDMSYKIEFKQRTILCAQLMCNAYENFAYREVQYTLNDIKLTKDDFNYICECCH